MDWMDPFWPDELSQVQWGPVSAWVGSLLTAGSLTLGFYILWRDTRLRGRGQASRVVIFGERFAHRVFPKAEGILHPSVRLYVRNASEQPIMGVAVASRKALSCYANDVEAQGPVTEEETVFWTIAAKLDVGEDYPVQADILVPNAEFFKNRCFPEHPGKGQLFVVFLDAQGRLWVRDVVSRRLSSWRYRHVRRLWRERYDHISPLYQY